MRKADDDKTRETYANKILELDKTISKPYKIIGDIAFANGKIKKAYYAYMNYLRYAKGSDNFRGGNDKLTQAEKIRERIKSMGKKCFY